MVDEYEESTVIADRSDVARTDPGAEHAYVIVIAGHGVGEMYKVDGTRVVGRGQDADIRLIDEAISRHHAQIEPSDGGVMVKDLGSTNGTFVNGSPIGQRLLRDGDKILVGTTTILKFTYHDDLEESFQRSMYESALRDGLTRAYNRKYFDERLDAEFAYARRHGTPLTLILVDLDDFKRVNDEHGHLAGDQVLTAASAALHEAIRVEDVFARYGGDEFALLSRGIGPGDGLRFGERLRRSIATHAFRWDELRVPVTASVGVASLPEEGIRTARDLVHAADQALFEAKRLGRDQVAMYRPPLAPPPGGPGDLAGVSGES